MDHPETDDEETRKCFEPWYPPLIDWSSDCGDPGRCEGCPGCRGIVDHSTWHNRADPKKCQAASQRSDGECSWDYCPVKNGETCPLHSEEYPS